MKKTIKKKATKKIVAKKKLPVKVVSKSKKSSWLGLLSIGNIIAFIAVLIVNYLAVSLPLGGMTTWALADLYPNLFTPAGLTFSIWGVIYLWLFVFVIWQAVDFYKKQSTGITKKIWIWFLLSCAANIWRMFARQYQYVLLSIIIMLVFLGILIVIANKIQLGKKLGSLWNKYLVQVPFSIYLWRISVATIANASAVLVHYEWNMFGLSDIFRTNLVIIIATIITIRSLKKTNNIIFALVVIRAFIGIILKRIDVDPVYATNILWTLGACIAIITAGIGRKFEGWKNN